MEEAATTAHVRERITSMQPQVQSLAQGYEETAVDLRLDGIQYQTCWHYSWPLIKPRTTFRFATCRSAQIR